MTIAALDELESPRAQGQCKAAGQRRDIGSVQIGIREPGKRQHQRVALTAGACVQRRQRRGHARSTGQIRRGCGFHPIVARCTHLHCGPVHPVHRLQVADGCDAGVGVDPRRITDGCAGRHMQIAHRELPDIARLHRVIKGQHVGRAVAHIEMRVDGTEVASRADHDLQHRGADDEHRLAHEDLELQRRASRKCAGVGLPADFCHIGAAVHRGWRHWLPGRDGSRVLDIRPDRIAAVERILDVTHRHALQHEGRRADIGAAVAVVQDQQVLAVAVVHTDREDAVGAKVPLQDLESLVLGQARGGIPVHAAGGRIG